MSDDSPKNNLFNAQYYPKPRGDNQAYATDIPIYDDAGNLQEGQDPAAQPQRTVDILRCFSG